MDTSKLREKVINIIQEKIEGNGRDVNDLLEYLDNSDFYTCPASSKHHGVYEGGLAYHVLCVYKVLRDKIATYKLDIPEDTVAIVALFHDLCKVNTYVKSEEPATEKQLKYLDSLLNDNNTDLGFDTRTLGKGYVSDLIGWLKDGAKGKLPTSRPTYEKKDELPLGHADKSLLILAKLIELTDEEMLAIKYHMYNWGGGNYYYDIGLKKAREMTPLVTLLYTADLEASEILGSNA